MSKPLLRIPYTGPLPPPLIIPPSAATRHGAIAALANFLTAPSPTVGQNVKTNTLPLLSSSEHALPTTLILTGAGLSTASGLADYRGANGTYTQNKSYRPIYFHEFVGSHASRQRYWARSFLGWRGLHRSSPNPGHTAIRDLGSLGIVKRVVTQNVDSFHNIAHPRLPTVELHGYLRTVVCLSCRREMDRDEFQRSLARLNPAWAEFLAELLATGALDTEDPEQRRKLGFKTNPDGDADVPGAPYSTFRYPACPTCTRRPPILPGGSGEKMHVVLDRDGAWTEQSGPGPAGILKPNVIMFGESIPQTVKDQAEHAVDEAQRLLVVGSSLATYSAWRLVKRAADRAMPIAILNLGGVRKEEAFFHDVVQAQTFDVSATQRMGIGLAPPASAASTGGGGGGGYPGAVRASLPAEDVLPGVVQEIKRLRHVAG